MFAVPKRGGGDKNAFLGDALLQPKRRGGRGGNFTLPQKKSAWFYGGPLAFLLLDGLHTTV